MRIQHIALAFAAWYLIVPPLAGTQGINTDAPQSDWSRAEAFRTWGDCDRVRQERIDSATHTGDDQAILFAESSKCDNPTPEPSTPQSQATGR
ncbi:MAG TPA: hypothetical protein VKS22_10240 [Candidatus Binataceae bacterium]|nr:hypothetical protein [Candidatus Binataceae bacterium]